MPHKLVSKPWTMPSTIESTSTEGPEELYTCITGKYKTKIESLLFINKVSKAPLGEICFFFLSSQTIQ